MKLTRDQILKLYELTITDQQFDALVILSRHRGGLTNRELTDLLEKTEREEGNVSRKIVQPLYLSGIICKKIKRKFKQHGVLLFINPNINSLQEIETQLEARILYYHYLDRKKVEECRKKNLWSQWKGVYLGPGQPVTDAHQEIRDRLVNYVHFHKWTNDVSWILGWNTPKEVDIVAPKCNFCRNLLNDNDITWPLYFERIPNLDDLVEKWVADFPFRYKRQNFVPNEQLVRLQQEMEEFYKNMGWKLKESGEGSK